MGTDIHLGSNASGLFVAVLRCFLRRTLLHPWHPDLSFGDEGVTAAFDLS